MKFKTKKEAIESITFKTRTVNGSEYKLYSVYLGTNLITKKQEKFASSSRERLVAMIEDYYARRNESGDVSAMLTVEQTVDASMALCALEKAGLDVSLLECAKAEIARHGISANFSKTAGEAYYEFIDSKSLNSELELRKTECTTGKWVGTIGRDRVLSTVTIDDITSYLRTNYADSAPSTYNSHVSYIRTFLSWCASQENKIIPENIALPIRLKPVAWKRPRYMKPCDVRRLFELLWNERERHPDYLALAVTQFFIGVRREEAIRMAANPDTATILIEDETFRVDGGKGYTKGVAPRAAHLSENAVAWIKSFDYMSAIEAVREHTTDECYALARANGVPMFKNCARHTFITMHVAKFHTPEVTQAMVGTSGTMRAVHYDGLAPQREGEEFFNIFPPTANESKEVA